MVTVVFVLGVVNFVLGFALAVLCERLQAKPLAWSVPWGRVWAAPPSGGDSANVQDKSRAGGAAEPDLAGLVRIPPDCIEPASVAEAALWTVKLELAEYREKQVAAEERLRSGDVGTIDLIVSTSRAWQERLSGLSAAVSSHQEGELARRSEIQEALLDYDFQLQTSIEKIDGLAAQQVVDEVTGQLICLLAAGDSLRDLVDNALAETLRVQQRLDQLTPALQHVDDSSVYTRLGLETLFHDWWSQDEDRVRLVSCVLWDLDRFAKVNDRWGTGIGDRILAAFETLLQDLIRQGRGFDRVARVSGQSFLLFLGDTASRNAGSGAERIRQTIEAASFRVGDVNLELTASCGVVEVLKSEGLSEVLTRLQACLAEAKKAGRNRSCTDVGAGPEPVALTQYQVQGRVIEI